MGSVGSGNSFLWLGWVRKFSVGLGLRKVTHDSEVSQSMEHRSPGKFRQSSPSIDVFVADAAGNSRGFHGDVVIVVDVAVVDVLDKVGECDSTLCRDVTEAAAAADDADAAVDATVARRPTVTTPIITVRLARRQIHALRVAQICNENQKSASFTGASSWEITK